MTALSLSSLGKLSSLTGVMQRNSICKTPGMYLADVHERMVLVEMEAKGRPWGLVKILSVDGC